MKINITPKYIYILAILVLIIVYFPSFFHLPRADHWNILMHTLGVNDPGEMIKKSYSYARQSLVAPGDVVLFRPLQSGLLAVEKYLFSPNSYWPQLINFALHISVFALVNILLFLWFNLLGNNKNTRVDLLLPIITSFFILNFSIVELAIWASLKGYLVFLILILSGIIFLTKIVSNPKALNLKYILLSWLFFLLAAFMYELGQFVCVISGVITGWTLLKLGNKKSALIISTSYILIFFIYRTINSLDYNLHLENLSYMHALGFQTGEGNYSYSNILKSFFSQSTLKNLWTIINYTIITPFFPLNTFIHAAGKVFIVKTSLLDFSFKAIPSYILFIMWITLLTRGLYKAIKSKNIYFIYFFLLISSILFAFYSIAILGRMNLRPDYAQLAQYSYYSYMGFGFFTILSAIAIYYEMKSAKNYISRVFIVLLVTVTVMSSLKVLKINRKVYQYQSYLRNVSDQINNFIDQHKSEDKIKLAFDIKNSDFSTMIPGAGIPSVYIFFYDYLNSNNPDFIFTVKNKNINFYTKTEHKKMYGNHEYLNMILKKVVSPYKIYQYYDTYYGIPYWILTFDPVKDNMNKFVIKDNNLSDVIKQIPVRLQNLKEATESQLKAYYSMNIINEDYKGFKITKNLNWYFATPKDDGILSIEIIERNRYSQWFSSTSLEELYSRIN